MFDLDRCELKGGAEAHDPYEDSQPPRRLQNYNGIIRYAGKHDIFDLYELIGIDTDPNNPHHYLLLSGYSRIGQAKPRLVPLCSYSTVTSKRPRLPRLVHYAPVLLKERYSLLLRLLLLAFGRPLAGALRGLTLLGLRLAALVLRSVRTAVA